MQHLLIGAMMIAGVSISSSTFAETITFDELAFPTGIPRSYQSLTVGDYLFTALQNDKPLVIQAQDDPNNADPAGATLGMRTIGQDLGFTMARVDGALFDFTGVQVTHFSNNLLSPGNGGPLVFYFVGAPIQQRSYDINPGFQTFALDGLGISSVRITSNNLFQIDNLVVSGGAVVPEPSSWILMIAGFGAIGMSLRSMRRTVTARIAMT